MSLMRTPTSSFISLEILILLLSMLHLLFECVFQIITTDPFLMFLLMRVISADRSLRNIPAYMYGGISLQTNMHKC